MPLVGTPDLRFTAKAGLVETAGELTSWTDQISSEVLSESTLRPKVGTTQLNGINVVTFNEDEFITTLNSTYNRSSGTGAETVVEALIKITSGTTGTRYITDAESAINRNAFLVGGSGNSRFANASDKVPDWGDNSLVLPLNEWGILRLVFSPTAGLSGRNHRVYWNGDLLFEAADGLIGTSSGSGIVWGVNSSGGNSTGIVFELAEVVEYAAQAQQSDADVLTNRDYYETEWGLLLSPTMSGTITLSGNAVPDSAVDIFRAINPITDNPSYVESVVADGNGVYTATVARDPLYTYWASARAFIPLFTGTLAGGIDGTSLPTGVDLSAESIGSPDDDLYLFIATGGTGVGQEAVILSRSGNNINLGSAFDGVFSTDTTFQIGKAKFPGDVFPKSAI